MSPLAFMAAGRWLLARAPWVMAAAALGVLLAICAYRGQVADGLRDELLEVRAAAAQAQAQAEARARQQEHQWAANVAAAEEDHAQRSTTLAAAVAAARTDGERLRRTLAATGHRPAAAPGAAGPADDRAAALGDLLAEADRLAEDGARAAEQHAEQVRALQGWVRGTQ